MISRASLVAGNATHESAQGGAKQEHACEGKAAHDARTPRGTRKRPLLAVFGKLDPIAHPKTPNRVVFVDLEGKRRYRHFADPAEAKEYRRELLAKAKVAGIVGLVMDQEMRAEYFAAVKVLDGIPLMTAVRHYRQESEEDSGLVFVGFVRSRFLRHLVFLEIRAPTTRVRNRNRPRHGKKSVAGTVPVSKPAASATSPVSLPQMPPTPVGDSRPVEIQRPLTGIAGPAIYPTGVVSRGDVLFVQMSDGSRRWVHRSSGDSDEVSLATPSSVTIDGQKLYIHAGERPAEAAPRYFPRPIWKEKDKNGEFEAPYQNTGSPVVPMNPATVADTPMKFDIK